MRGELLIVLSPSGGGKSTILKLALGLMEPDEGRILIDGEDITDYDEEALNRVRLKLQSSVDRARPQQSNAHPSRLLQTHFPTATA